MEYLKGKNFLLYIVEGGVNKPVACATSMTLSFSANMEEVTKPTESRARNFAAGMTTYSITLDGLFVVNENVYSGDDLLVGIMEGLSLPWIAEDMALPVRYSGNVLISDLGLTSPADNDHTFSVTLQGQGDLIRTANDSFLLQENNDSILQENDGNIKL